MSIKFRGHLGGPRQGYVSTGAGLDRASLRAEIVELSPVIDITLQLSLHLVALYPVGSLRVSSVLLLRLVKSARSIYTKRKMQ
jgi:hypothetical protein